MRDIPLTLPRTLHLSRRSRAAGAPSASQSPCIAERRQTTERPAASRAWPTPPRLSTTVRRPQATTKEVRTLLDPGRGVLLPPELPLLLGANGVRLQDRPAPLPAWPLGVAGAPGSGGREGRGFCWDAFEIEA